ncbi:uroporphyrinogen-III synthase [uncultured Hyphomicrobium sp.]|uniref:uroporphyrinogen-III synthase n=1 Tax=uncultured Hyphomicrobium sp. TaxID=194373 RepID=UPI0025FF6C04|nr:uroporphyrinogen-III synthase [uncultured Hyphomicrobium sp.]
MHILSTRPDTGAEPDPLVAALRAQGHRVTQAPLLSVVPVGGMPTLNGVQALIVTSRNGLKAVAPFAGTALGLPLYAVGPGTAALARSHGFRTVIEGPGTGRALAEIIASEADPAAGALVHLAGETLAFDLKGALEDRGFAVRTEIVYRTEPAGAFPGEVAEMFRQGGFDAVVLMSPRTAKVYATLIGHADLGGQARRTVHFCLSDAVGQELIPLGAVRIAVSPLPNSEEMLALIAREASESS